MIEARIMLLLNLNKRRSLYMYAMILCLDCERRVFFLDLYFQSFNFIVLNLREARENKGSLFGGRAMSKGFVFNKELQSSLYSRRLIRAALRRALIALP